MRLQMNTFIVGVATTQKWFTGRLAGSDLLPVGTFERLEKL
jgi:hypothetical protein